MTNRKRIRPVGIVPVPVPDYRDTPLPPPPPSSTKELEMNLERLERRERRKGALSPEEKIIKKALKRKIKEQKKSKEPEIKYPIRRIPKIRKKPPISRQV